MFTTPHSDDGVADDRAIGRASFLRTPKPRHLNNGFTLIELMAVVAIMGILAAISVPSYGTYVQRSRTFEATINLLDMHVRLGRYFRDNRQYPDACVAPVTNSTPADSIYLPKTTQYFSITCMFPTATAYTITATGLPAQGMDGFVYTIDEANVHRTTSLPAGWVGVGSTCWVTNRSGAC